MKQSRKIIAAKIASMILVFPSGSSSETGGWPTLSMKRSTRLQRIQTGKEYRAIVTAASTMTARADGARNPFVSAATEQRVDDVAAVELPHGKKVQRGDEQRAPRGPINRVPMDPAGQIKQHHYYSEKTRVIKVPVAHFGRRSGLGY